MGSRLEKLKRMRVAAVVDEDPVVKFMTAAGVKARRNETAGGLKNRKEGDVIIEHDGTKYSVECQVVSSEKRYDKFSYGAEKVRLYRGAGLYGHAYTLLGCYEKKGGTDMIFLLVPARTLHTHLEGLTPGDLGHGTWLNDPPPGQKGSQYYTINPENIATLEGSFVGSSIEEVLAQFCSEVLGIHGRLGAPKVEKIQAEDGTIALTRPPESYFRD